MSSRDDLLRQPDVIGIADGRVDDQACIKVYVRRAVQAQAAKIPQWIDGLPVVVEVAGNIVAGKAGPGPTK